MLSCRETVEIVSDGKSLPIYKKPGLWLHLVMCKACRLYLKQISTISSFAKKINVTNETAEKELEKKILDHMTKNVEKK